MKFSVLFSNLRAAKRAQSTLTNNALISTGDVTSVHNKTIRMTRLPFTQTRARGGAIVGATLVGVIGALVFSAVALFGTPGFSLWTALALGAGVGVLYGGVLGAIAYSTEPAPFVDTFKDKLRDGRAVLVCEINDQDRAERARKRLLHAPGVESLAVA